MLGERTLYVGLQLLIGRAQQLVVQEVEHVCRQTDELKGGKNVQLEFFQFLFKSFCKYTLLYIFSLF